MKTNTGLFWLLSACFALFAIAYTVWAYIDFQQRSAISDTVEGAPIDWVGTVALSLSAILAAFIAFYIGRTSKAVGGELPEDRLDANIDDGDPELGFFGPWSWWPLGLGAALAVIFLGLAVGFWVIAIGMALLAVMIVGWQYEYYRGNYSR